VLKPQKPTGKPLNILSERQGSDLLTPVQMTMEDKQLLASYRSSQINDALYHGQIKDFREALTKAIQAYRIEIGGFKDAETKELWHLSIAQCEKALVIYNDGLKEAKCMIRPGEARTKIVQKLRAEDLDEFALGLEKNDYSFLSF